MHQARRHDYTLEHARNNQKPSAPLPGVQRLYNLIAKKRLCHAHLFRCLIFWARTLCSSSAAVAAAAMAAAAAHPAAAAAAVLLLLLLLLLLVVVFIVGDLSEIDGDDETGLLQCCKLGFSAVYLFVTY